MMSRSADLWRQLRLLLVVCIIFLLIGCAGLSKQYRATTEGIAINYVVTEEKIVKPKAKIFITVTDGRADKEVIGDGAKPTVGSKFMGYFALGILYAAVPDQPRFQSREDSITIFRTAMSERLAKNGIIVTDKNEEGAVMVDLLIKAFKLDFSFGSWMGDAGYQANVHLGDQVICEKTVGEKSKVFNMWGYGSGEKAINEVFSKAINGLDVNDCFSKL
jgi:hypothetical protein